MSVFVVSPLLTRPSPKPCRVHEGPGLTAGGKTCSYSEDEVTGVSHTGGSHPGPSLQTSFLRRAVEE